MAPRHAVAWDFESIGDVAQVSSGGTPNRNQPTYWGGTIPWVTTSAIDFGTITKTDEFITEDGLQNSSAKVFPKGTLLMAMYGQGATRGKVAILGIDAATNQACASIIPGNRLEAKFLFYYLQSQYERIRNTGHGGNQTNLSGQLIKEFPVPVPSLAEQNKLVGIFECWDRTIELIQRLIAEKQLGRMALMQQLLFGKRRFPGFSGEWTKVRIGEVLTEIKRPVKWDDDHKFRLISVRRRSGGLFMRGDLQGNQIKTKKMNLAKTGDFLISKMQVVHGALGLVTHEFDGMHVSDSYISLRARKPEQFDIRFFDWLSRMPWMYHQAYLSSCGVHIEKMTFDVRDFLNREVRIPPSREEQEYIVRILDLASEEIKYLEGELDALALQKKGLMQQLLTGKRRVNVSVAA